MQAVGRGRGEYFTTSTYRHPNKLCAKPKVMVADYLNIVGALTRVILVFLPGSQQRKRASPTQIADRRPKSVSTAGLAG